MNLWNQERDKLCQVRLTKAYYYLSNFQPRYVEGNGQVLNYTLTMITCDHGAAAVVAAADEDVVAANDDDGGFVSDTNISNIRSMISNTNFKERK